MPAWFFFDIFEQFFIVNQVPLELILIIVLAIQYVIVLACMKQRCDGDEETPNQVLLATTHIKWYKDLLRKYSTSRLSVDEWRSEEYRKAGGWRGKDYMHSSQAHVRIFDYFLLSSRDLTDRTEDGVDFALSAIVYFSACAESHKGLCHGGTMCACMDDAIGWLGFCESGSCLPWSGYTVQVDTSLRKPVVIGSYLRLDVWIKRREGERKIFLAARLHNPDSGEEHATATGLFLKSVKKEPKKLQ